MIVLVDTQNLAFRALHTTQEVDAVGEPCGVVSGTLRMISKVLSNLRSMRPEDNVFLVAGFDFGRCAWRSELYSEYKAGRTKPNLEEFLPQMKRLERVLPALGAITIKSLNVECDDLLAVLCHEFKARTGEEIYVVTSDRDLWQLVDDRVLSVDMQTGNLVDRDAVVERFGVGPERVAEYKALVGDSSDNIKGAKGIGEKTALQILNAHPSIPELLRQIENQEVEIASPTMKKLAASVDSVRMAGKLCSLPQTVDELFTLEAREATAALIDRVLTGNTPPLDPDVMIGLETLQLGHSDLKGFLQS